jgi:hypothetical protein
MKEMIKLREELSRKGYYDQCLPLKPLSQYLQSFAAQEKVERVVNNLLRFRSYRGQRITASVIRSYVIQFPEDLHESTLTLLEQIVLVEPSEIAAAVIKEFKELTHESDEVVGVVPVGNLTDSATHLLYELKNHPDQEVRELGPRIAALQAGTIKGCDRLLFFDDNTNSGLQVLNVFASWLGETLPEDVDLSERHVDELPSKVHEKLRKMKLGFVFGVAPEGADAKIPALFEEYLKIPAANIKVTIGRTLMRDKRLLSGTHPSVEIPQRAELRKFFRSNWERVDAERRQNTRSGGNACTRRASVGGLDRFSIQYADDDIDPAVVPPTV